MAKLVVLSEGFTGLTHEIKVDKTTVGRSQDNTFQIEEASVSSCHCEIVRKGSGFLVKDLDSTNGTFINGEKVSQTELKPGQILRLGQVEIRLETESSKPAKPQAMDQTMVLPKGAGGVNKDELEHHQSSIIGKEGPFKKQSDKGTKIFIGAAIVVGVIIIGLIIFAIQKMT